MADAPDATQKDLSLAQTKFLAAFAETGLHQKSAEVAGVNVVTAYRWSKKGNQVYDLALVEATAIAAKHLEDYARELAMKSEKPDRMILLRLLEAYDPRFRQKREVSHSGSLEHTVKRVVLEGGLPTHLQPAPEPEEESS